MENLLFLGVPILKHIRVFQLISIVAKVTCFIFEFQEKSSEKYELVLVGHSLGAGTAAILAILLQQEYTDLHCYSYSPPGGLLRYDLCLRFCISCK